MEIGGRLRELEHGAAVRGWRVWTVVETTAGLRLGSPLYTQLWLPAEPALATCKRDEDPFAEAVAAHEPCSALCGCGFHAVRDPVDAFSYLRGRDERGTVGRILGEVTLWGHVLTGDSGWRATIAYPARLYTSDADLARALGVYDVAVESGACSSTFASSTTDSSGASPTSSSSAARTHSSSRRRSG